MELKKIGIQTGVRHNMLRGSTKNALEVFSAAVPGATLYVGPTMKEIAEQTDDLDMVIAGPEAFDEFGVDYILKAPSLKWIQGWISGVDFIFNSGVIKKEGLRVSACRGVHATSLSDHVIAFIYYYMRQFPAVMAARKAFDWDAGNNAPADEAMAKTVGLVGLGNIGLEIARKCHYLGFRVLAAKRNPIECQWVEHCYPITELNKFLGECDYVVLILPHTPESEGMMGKEQFEAMKQNAVLINVARGAVVDEQALLEALDSGEIAAAALDAFSAEPLPVDNPIWSHEKIFMTYHMAARSSLIRDKAIDVLAENLRRYDSGEPLLFEEVITK